MLDLYWTLISTFFVITVLSYLYRDNIFYKFTEHVFIGIASAMVLVAALRTFLASGWEPLIQGRYMLIIPIIIGVSVFTQLTKDFKWISNFPFAILLAIGLGVAMRGTIFAQILDQIIATIPRSFGPTVWDTLNTLIIISIVIASTIYFLFSIPQKGPIQHISTYGIYALLIAFGAGFANYIYSFTSNALQAAELTFTLPGMYLTVIAGLIIAIDSIRSYRSKRVK